MSLPDITMLGNREGGDEEEDADEEDPAKEGAAAEPAGSPMKRPAGSEPGSEGKASKKPKWVDILVARVAQCSDITLLKSPRFCDVNAPAFPVFACVVFLRLTCVAKSSSPALRRQAVY